MGSFDLFSGRQILVATKHGKEQVIAPLLSEALGLTCVVTDLLDTDLLGTFAGEVERSKSPLDTARQKCHMAMDITSTDLAIASEGSFGPHPNFPFIPAHEEILVLIDKINAWEFVVKRLETKTNYSQILLQSYDELEGFLAKALFPSHAFIIKKSSADTTDCVKGVHDEKTLRETIQFFMQCFGQCSLETDMRAMHNPTRMAVIHDLTKELIQQIQTACPTCQAPGFRISDIERGLPCALCGQPTRSVKFEIYACHCCQFSEHRAPSHGLKMEDPMYCDFCNP